MPSNVQTAIQTMGDVFDYMAPFAGGEVPSETDAEFSDWTGWVQNKQEEYARRGFWRRCLTRVELELDGETTLLPVRFHKPNGLYMVAVDGVNWMDENNTDEQSIFVEMVNDSEDDNYGRWQMRFGTEITTAVDAIVWYFANPPKPTATTDKLLLPGDMIAYAALSEYYRGARQEGSQDKAEQDAENRFQEYLSIETIPAPNELLRFSDGAQQITKVDYLKRAKLYYTNRPNRNRQSY